MKKIITLGIILVSLSSFAAASLEIVPYYNYQLTQGVSVSPDGNLGFLLNLSNDIGTIVQPFENHTFIGFYALQYQGPGLKQQEGREFRERYLNHILAARHHWDIGEITLKSQLGLLLERKRSGTNETWDSGLYNFNRLGGSSAVSGKFLGIDSTISLGYHFLTFPNYTDLLAEIRGGADASGTAGTQNHHSLRLSYSGNVNKNHFWAAVNPLFYTTQRVAVDEAQSDGSYYSGTKQREIILSAGGRREEQLTENISISPELDLTFRMSNQNYQHFMEVTSTAPVSFHGKFFNYIEPSLSLPVALRLSYSWTYFISPSISYRRYTNRMPRDSEGNFLEGENQNRLLGVYSTGFKKQTGESSSTVFFFTYQNQISNMKFERYMPYTYSGFSLGIRYQMEY